MDNRYTIRQLSQLSGLSLHTLRYYEKAGLLQGVGRSGSGHREYRERDLAWAQLVAGLRKSGMPISRLRQLAEWRDLGNEAGAERRRLLEAHRDELRRQLAEMRDNLAFVERKLELVQALEERENTLPAYYAQRAEHYERVYHRGDPVRQAELGAVERDLRERLEGRRVLEIACGTGYWTAKIIGSTSHITAIDATAEVLSIARHKGLDRQKAVFLPGDAYRLEEVPGAFDAALAAFWFSHVPKRRVREFLNGMHRRIGPGAVVCMVDNVLNPGIGGELVVKPGEADTYKLRELADGSRHEVLKNYYTAQELTDLLGPLSSELVITVGDCYWRLSYKVKG